MFRLTDFFTKKTETHRLKAEESFENKLKSVVAMQHMAYEVMKSTGRKPTRPWHMPQEQYDIEIRYLK